MEQSFPTRFALLFDPLDLPSGIVLPNRIVLAPMTTWSSNPDGTIHQSELAYLSRRASGMGMVITAACFVVPEGRAFSGQWGCHNDDMIPSLRKAVKVIHATGAMAILQLHHGGRMCPASLLGHAPVSASAVPALRPGADTPREMSRQEIHKTITAFSDATARAIEAGYDGVEIHGANTYLLQQFFSPHSNRRTDEWGGSLEKRMCFPLAVLDAVLKRSRDAGHSFAVGFRLSPEEIEEPGITIDDTLAFIDVLASRKIDWIHVSVRDYRKGSIRDKNDTTRPTRRIIDVVAKRVPLIGVGKVYSPDDAMFILNDGCSCIALGRIALMEPDWVEKVRTGREDTVRTVLSSHGADRDLTIPQPMYRKLLDVEGWLPVTNTSRE